MDSPSPAVPVIPDRDGVRVGTAEFYAAVEELPGIVETLVVDTGRSGRDGTLLLFVVVRPGEELNDRLRGAIHARLRAGVSPRLVPDAIYAVPELPRTPDGEKADGIVRRILNGASAEEALRGEAVANPDSLGYFVDLFNNL